MGISRVRSTAPRRTCAYAMSPGRRAAPGARCLAAGDHGEDGIRQGWHEDLAEPRIHEPEGLVRVEHEHGAARTGAEPGYEPVQFGLGLGRSERGGERSEESSRRWLDVPAVKNHRAYAGTGETAGCTDEARLADAPGTVKEGDDERKLWRIDRGAELIQFLIPTDE